MTTRKEYLLSHGFGTLQSTPEYEHFLSEYVHSESRCMTTEVEYILKKSVDDSDAPFSYDDLDLSYYDDDQMRDDILQVFRDIVEDDDQTEEEFKEEVESFNGDLYMIDKPNDTLNLIMLHLADLDDDDLKDLIEKEPALSGHIFVNDYERYAEVYEWYLMDDRILKELEALGEIILNDEYWGRTSFGQAFAMDKCIIDVFHRWYLNIHWIESKFNLNDEYKPEVKE